MAGKNSYQSSVKLPPLADLFSTQEEREEATLEKVMPIPLAELHDFPNHPFQVRDDAEMEKMAESVNTYGVLVPAIVRPRTAGGYEVISGHRRKLASQKAGKLELPCLVREMDDDTAIILMVDSNCQRENVLPSEKAKAFQMKLEAIKRKSGRPSLNNSRQVVGNLESADIVGKDIGESGRQIQRYIRLNSLIPELQQLVDDKTLKFNPAVEVSYLTPDEQKRFYEYIDTQSCTPSLSQAQRLKQASKAHALDEQQLETIMAAQPSVKPRPEQVALPRDKLSRYFPASFTSEQIVGQILKLLEAQYRHRQQGMER